MKEPLWCNGTAFLNGRGISFYSKILGGFPPFPPCIQHLINCLLFGDFIIHAYVDPQPLILVCFKHRSTFYPVTCMACSGKRGILGELFYLHYNLFSNILA